MMAQRIVDVTVPDCTNVQPWYMSSGMTVVVWFLFTLIIVAVAALVGLWIDGRQKR